jgi:hypothetical protein
LSENGKWLINNKLLNKICHSEHREESSTPCIAVVHITEDSSLRSE